MVALLKLAAGVQEYTYPTPFGITVRVALPPKQMLSSTPASTDNTVFTVTVEMAVAEHPRDVPVTV